MDCSLPDSSVHGILRARILEWAAIPFFRGSSQPRDWTQVSCFAGRFFTICCCVCVFVCVCKGDKKGLKREVRLRSRSEEATHLAREFASYQDNKAISQAFKQENDKT